MTWNRAEHSSSVRGYEKVGGASHLTTLMAGMISANRPPVEEILKTMRDCEGKHENDCWTADAAAGDAVFASDDTKEETAGVRRGASQRASRSLPAADPHQRLSAGMGCMPSVGGSSKPSTWA
jgi:hypothetical protein